MAFYRRKEPLVEVFQIKYTPNEFSAEETDFPAWFYKALLRRDDVNYRIYINEEGYLVAKTGILEHVIQSGEYLALIEGCKVFCYNKESLDNMYEKVED